jgi:hypothetical protein
VLEHAQQVDERDVRGLSGGSGVDEQRGRGGAGAGRGDGRVVADGVEAERAVGPSPRLEVARVEGLQRVPGGDGVAHASARRRRRAVERVEQLAERDGRRDGRSVRLSAPVQVMTRCCPAALTASSSSCGPPRRGRARRPTGRGEDVVAVAGALPREGAVVHAEQADDAGAAPSASARACRR